MKRGLALTLGALVASCSSAPNSGSAFESAADSQAPAAGGSTGGGADGGDEGPMTSGDAPDGSTSMSPGSEAGGGVDGGEDDSSSATSGPAETCGTGQPLAEAVPCGDDFSLGSDFAAYSCWQLGSVPGLEPDFGYSGLAIAPGDPNVLVIRVYTEPHGLYRIGLARDADCNIIGFTDEQAELWWQGTPGGFGDIAFGPNDVLAIPNFDLSLGLLRLGDDAPTAATGPIDEGIRSSGLGYVPAGFPAAGTVKFVAGNDGSPGSFGWWSSSFSVDADGLPMLTGIATDEVPLGEYGAMTFVSPDSPAVDVPSVLISNAASQNVRLYELDGNGDPVLDAGRTFISGNFNTAGATADPNRGSFMFSASTFGNDVVVVHGFEAPDPPPG